MWKTTIVIWTDYDPSHVELDHLAREATSGDAYCSKQHIEHVPNHQSDPDWDDNEFFGSVDDAA